MSKNADPPLGLEFVDSRGALPWRTSPGNINCKRPPRKQDDCALKANETPIANGGRV
jgi:hypothetical protein